MPADSSAPALPGTAALLVAGGDARIALDAQTGLSMYGCCPYPDPELVALGSSTASLISAPALAACEALRATWLAQLRGRPAADVYAEYAQRLRQQLLALCGCAPADGVELVLGASGTDLHLLAGQWLRPELSVMVAPAETGSGVAPALQGRHFNRRSASGGEVRAGALLGDWMGRLATLEARTPDGSPRQAASIDAECVACVDAAAGAGQRVLLVLTDVSKTGMLVPGIATALQLQRRWSGQVEILVDACQFRLAPATVRAYLARDCMVALTGSKFMGGPTFSGALLLPPATAARHRERTLGAAAQAYSNRADWPDGWAAGLALPASANFGLLLRWEAALTEMRAFFGVPEDRVARFLRRFETTLRHRMAQQPRFEALPVAPLERAALGVAAGSWDAGQTIFPFLLLGRSGRPLARDETMRLYRLLRHPDGGDVAGAGVGSGGMGGIGGSGGMGGIGASGAAGARRFQLGQPVPCGVRDGVPVSALRLCVSAPMVVAACRDGQEERVVADAIAALERLASLLAQSPLG